MSKTTKWGATDWLCLALAGLIGGGVFAFRWFAVVPVSTVGQCAAANAPAFCTPRHWMLLGQYYDAWGWSGLALGLAAFFLGSRVLAALALGAAIASVVNYNATQGIIGAALGLAAWGSLISNRPGWRR
jgi:hypothetical protein